jgi:hypothetical protein
MSPSGWQAPRHQPPHLISRTHKYRHQLARMTAMDADGDHDDLTDDNDEATYRERAAAMLDQIAQQAKQALSDAGIGIGLFFIVPRSGKAILNFGTPGDPPDDLWDKVRDIVSAIVRRSIGLERLRCRELACATTHRDAAMASESPSVG